MALRILKGNKMMALINSKTTSIVKPRILNGSNINHNSGRKKSRKRASGQEIAKRINHSKIDTRAFMLI